MAADNERHVDIMGDERMPNLQWLDAAEAEQLYSVERHWLRRQARRGLILSAKLGKSKQARRVYSVRDLEKVLTTLAEAELAVTQEK